MQIRIYYHLRKFTKLSACVRVLASSLKKKLMHTGTQVKHKDVKHNLLGWFLLFFPSVQYLCRLQGLGWGALYQFILQAKLVALQAKKQISKLECSYLLGSRHIGGPLVCPYTGATFLKGHYCSCTWALKGQGWRQNESVGFVYLFFPKKIKKSRRNCFGHEFHSLDHRSAVGKV